jgi:hypothetical protein
MLTYPISLQIQVKQSPFSLTLLSIKFSATGRTVQSRDTIDTLLNRTTAIARAGVVLACQKNTEVRMNKTVLEPNRLSIFFLEIDEPQASY